MVYYYNYYLTRIILLLLYIHPFILGSDFGGEAMNTIDMILNQIGQPTDGLGPNWSPLERIVHKFHMKDLWAELKGVYDEIKEVQYQLQFCAFST